MLACADVTGLFRHSLTRVSRWGFAMSEARIALVLSGGGSLGAVQVGMLQALADSGFRADLVVGASVGALNGAFYAQQPDAGGVERLAALWRGLRRDDVFPLSLPGTLRALLGGRGYLSKPDRLRGIIHRALDVRRIEDTRIPLHVAATEVMSGAEVLLSSGDIDTALLASAAIPLVFPQVEIDGRSLIDAGVSDNTPIASAVELGARRIVVLPTGTSCALREPPRGMRALALHVLALLSMRQLDRDVERFAQAAEITVVPPLCPVSIGAFNFSHTRELMLRSLRQTRVWLAEGGMAQSGPLQVPLAHFHAPHCEPSRTRAL